MLVLFGLGVHRDMTPEEARVKLGDADLRGTPWRNHSCSDERNLKYLGTTSRGTYVSLNRHLSEADLIIPVGAIEPHLLLGFSGGCKMLMPGLAFSRTIGENHMQGVSPERYNYAGAPESPIRLDLEEGARMLGKEIFIVNVVMNESSCTSSCPVTWKPGAADLFVSIPASLTTAAVFRKFPSSSSKRGKWHPQPLPPRSY